MKVRSLIILILLSVALLPFDAGAQENQTPITLETTSQLVESVRLNLGSGFDGSAPSIPFSFSPDNQNLVLADENGLRMYNMDTGELGEYFFNRTAFDPVFSTDGSSIAAYTLTCTPGDCQGDIHVFNATSGEETFSTGFQGYVDSVVFSPDGTHIAYGVSETRRVTSQDAVGRTTGTGLGPSGIHIVDLSSGEDTQLIEEARGIIGDIFFNTDGTLLGYTSMKYDKPSGEHESGVFHIVDTSTGEDRGGFSAGYLVAALNPDWTQAAVTTFVVMPGVQTFNSRVPFLVDVETGETLGDVAPFKAWGHTFAFNSTWTLLAADVAGETDGSGAIAILDAGTNEKLAILPIEKFASVSHLAFATNDAHLAAYFQLENDDNFYLGLWGLPEGAASDEASATSPEAQNADSVTIHGSVYASQANSLPIAGVEMELSDPSKEVEAADYHIATTVTDENGAYEFTDLVPGQYILSAIWTLTNTPNISCNIDLTFRGSWFVAPGTDDAGHSFILAVSDAFEVTDLGSVVEMNLDLACP